MHGICITVGWEMGHRLSQGYEGPCSNIHGHSYKAEFCFEQGDLNSVGFIRDFKEIKGSIKKYIDAQFDHVLLISDHDPLKNDLIKLGVNIVTLSDNPTAEVIAHVLFDKFSKAEDWPRLREVRVWETESCCATFDDYGEDSDE